MKNAVEAYYDRDPGYEWNRLERHRMEFGINTRTIAEFMEPGARVLDVGGGPGRYSLFLAERGHAVTLLDLSSGNLEFARGKAAEAGIRLEGFVHGNALDLSGFGDGSFDAVLLMGPLYHLTDPADRDRAVAEAARVLKPGGLVFAAFLCRYALLSYVLRTDVGRIAEFAGDAMRIAKEGSNPESGSEWVGTTHYVDPGEVGPFMGGNGFEGLCLTASEGVTSVVEPAINALDDETFAMWLDINCELGRNPSCMGLSEHLLYVGRKAGA